MGRKNKKRHKNVTVTPCDNSATNDEKVLHNLTTDFKIEFFPVVADQETGRFENTHFVEKLLQVYEKYYPYFDMDGIPKPDDYKEWLGYTVWYINRLYPYFCAVVVDDVLSGALWADKFEYSGEETLSVEFNGFAFPGVKLTQTREAIRQFCGKLFDETGVKIIRTVHDENNRAALWADRRAGFREPVKIRYWNMKNGEPVTGIMHSMTRLEFLNG